MTHAERMQAEYSDGVEQVAARIDAPALDRINNILSAPDWSVGMLEDINDIVRSTGRVEVQSDYLRH